MPPPAPNPATKTGQTPPGPMLTGAHPDEAAETEQGPRPRSRLYRAVAMLAYLGLLGALAATTMLVVLALDFLDLVSLRYQVPESLRGKWPLVAYYDFVRLHQLPEEERFLELIQREQKRFDEVITQGGQELKKRGESLEAAYRDLVRVQEERFRKREEELRQMQEDLLAKQRQIEDKQKDIQVRQEALDVVAKQLASEAVSLESSLIRFMEEENRLKPVQEIAASMDPRSIAGVFDEVADNKLIYQILQGVPPERSGLILSYMDPEKAGKILKMSQLPLELPAAGGPTRNYVPPSLEKLIESAQANLR
jgi:flagellar motility protein MotE (MotC chaperone)